MSVGSDQDEAPRLTVYADYVCPFCYLGKRSLEQYRREREEPLSIEWHPFDLRSDKRDADGDIDESVDDGKDEAYFDQVQENVARLQEEYGAAEMRTIDDVPDVDSLNAQVASLFVQENRPDRWEAFDDRIYEALWEEGRDVGATEVLLELATDVGLDAADVETALTSSERRQRVFDAFDRANRMGITGVPTFVADNRVARGAVPPAHLERLLDGNGSRP